MTQFDGENGEALKNALWSYAGKTLNMTDEDLASVFLNEDGAFIENANDVLLQKHSDHIKKISGDSTLKFNQGHAKGLAEALKKHEEKLREEFSIESNAKGVDLVKEILDKQTADIKAGIKPAELTVEAVQSHPEYKKLMESVKTVENDYKTQIQQLQEASQLEKTTATVRNYASKVVESLKPVFDKDPTRAANQKANLINIIVSQGWKVEEGGKVLPVNKDGELIKNSQGFAIDGSEYIKSITEQYHSLQTTPQHNATNPNVDRNKKLDEGMPTNLDEYNAMLDAAVRKPERLKELKTFARAQSWYA